MTESFRRLNREDAAALVIHALSVKASPGDPDWRTRWDAMTQLGRIGPPAVPALIQALRRENIDVWIGAASALSTMGADAAAAVPELAAGLSDGRLGVRLEAARRLGDIGRAARPALPALRMALADTDHRVRKEAAAAIDVILEGAF